MNKVLHKHCGGEIQVRQKEIVTCDKCKKEITQVAELLSESIIKDDDSEVVTMVKENQ